MRFEQIQERLEGWGVAALFLISAAVPHPAEAQELRGVVLDDRSGEPVSEVRLELLNVTGDLAHSRITDAEGAFRFSGIVPGHYRLVGQRLGYRETVSGFIALEEGETVELEFRMAVEAIVLDPLTVTASPRPWYEHVKAPALWEYYERSEHLKTLGRGRFLGQEELRSLSGMPVSLAIATVPGMQAVQSEDGPGRFHVLGRRGCDVLFFLNGMQVRLRSPVQPDDTTSEAFVPGPASLDWFLDDFVSLHDVEAMEIYRGSSELPGEFHGFQGGANCGAVVVWTKRGVDPVREGGEG